MWDVKHKHTFDIATIQLFETRYWKHSTAGISDNVIVPFLKVKLLIFPNQLI